MTLSVRSVCANARLRRTFGQEAVRVCGFLLPDDMSSFKLALNIPRVGGIFTLPGPALQEFGIVTPDFLWVDGWSTSQKTACPFYELPSYRHPFVEKFTVVSTISETRYSVASPSSSSRRVNRSVKEFGLRTHAVSFHSSS